MTQPDPRPLDDTTAAQAGDGAPAKQHGDPLMASAQGRGDGSDASRQGADADGQDASGQDDSGQTGG